jgi:hypothetical protein
MCSGCRNIIYSKFGNLNTGIHACNLIGYYLAASNIIFSNNVQDNC